LAFASQFRDETAWAYVTNRKQTASFSIARLMLAIGPLWMMLAAAHTSSARANI